MIYIVRHGQTELNIKQVLQGRSNYPLNEKGIEQAREAAERLRSVTFSQVFSSPLVRAIETAEIIMPDVPVTIDERLIEMDYGPYEGMGLNALAPEVITFFSDFANNPAPDGMEQLDSVVSRTGAFIEELSGLDGNILVSTHAIAMKGMLEYLTPDSHGSYWSRYIGNCAVFTTEYKNGVFSVPVEIQ